MDRNTNVGKNPTKKEFYYEFHSFVLTSLREVGSLMDSMNEKIFRDSYGNLLTLMDVDYEKWAMVSLL